MAKIGNINGLPVFEAVISEEEGGMSKISLVDSPAVMSNFMLFAAEKTMKFAVADEEKRLMRGVIMRADFPIIRIDANRGKFYVIYTAATIREMAEKYLAEGKCNNINLMHADGTDVQGVRMVQYFIKDTAAGINPVGFEDIADGSLFGEFHCTNDAVWDAVKAGIFKGFSLEGWFGLVPAEDQNELDTIVDALAGKFGKLLKIENDMAKMSKLKTALSKLLMEQIECSSATTDKGVIYFVEDELAEGVEVFSDEAMEIALEDGEYTREDGNIVVVSGGKVAEIRIPEATAEETAPEGESTEAAEAEIPESETPEAPAGDAEDADAEDGRIAALEERMAAMESKLNEILAALDGLNPAAEEMTAMRRDIEELKARPAADSSHDVLRRAVVTPEELATDRRCVRRKSIL